MFLVMLYNASFMFQKNNETNFLTMALDTLDLDADVDHEKFMSTMSENKKLRTFPFRKNSFKKILTFVFVHFITKDAISWYTFEAAFVIANSAIARKNDNFEDRGGNHELFEHFMHSWVGYEIV